MSLTHLVRNSGIDWRRYALSGLFLVWTAVGILLQADILLELNIPLAYSYLFVLGLFGQTFPSAVVFWIGYAIFCFLVATILVGLFDWVRDRVSSVDWRVVK